ncbi:NADH-ubiquinone/plastoquinone oxidoreductase chain 6 [Solidesulfovibrio carbinoliphilus subsp. oakridgensis]|uniref:NADH-quinone oxidoreductase subunit J n=1 Tax=Solidesulfovibrio carbinoliphilus subsp. oakridgensis TaxID=694327 RepID=G7QBT5_9BACT|nr:NADH-quinone oxidoreductase subunit J [Solidesulfovibrio carbinoliphilus]EHJ49428.1 NADH-ubiquinone/plastoquinone oxidoreductase chain 6 [Solidesulfovibrio carbinoliphilus subsp. oakridgensis]
MNEMYLGQFAFAFYTLIILAGGLLAVGAQGLVRAMLGLVVSLFGVAGLYLLLLADFVALMQILIYVGAVTILMFFAIMLTRASADGGEAEGPGFAGILRAIPAFLVPAGILVPFLAVHGTPGFATPKNVSPDQLGAGLLGPYTLPFELISVVLLAAMAGAVLLAFEKRGAR